MIKFAYGELNIGERFYTLTLREYQDISEGYFKRLERKWLHTREILAKIHNTNVSKTSDLRTPKQLVPLNIDKELDKRKAKGHKEGRKLLESKQYKKKQKQLERILKKVHEQ